MSKLERLLRLAELKREGEHLTIRELSQACGVSQRTVFRYLNTLAELDWCDGRAGERERPGADSMAVRLHPDDLSLLFYALDNNPLTGYPYFARRFLQIGRLAAAARTPLPPPGLFEIEATERAVVDTDTTDILTGFSRCRAESRSVRVYLKKRKRPIPNLRPKAIRLDGDRVRLVLHEPESGRLKTFLLGAVRRLEPGRKARRTAATGRVAAAGRSRSQVKKG